MTSTRALATLLLITSVATSICGIAPRALAQNDKAGAEVLLQQGIALAKEGKLAEACPKLEESLRLYPSINTKYHLADCYERSGKIASAFIEFQEVADKAHAAGEVAKEAKARDRAAALAPKVSHLTVTISTEIAGLEVKRGGVLVGKGTWGTELPIDPGSYEIVASAPGYVAFRTTIVIKTDGARETVVVPALVAAPSVPTPVTTTASTAGNDTSTGSSRKTIGLVVAGAGLVTVGVGGFLALSAKSQYDDAQCTGGSCSQAGADARDAARGKGSIATIVMGIGGALLVGGVVLWLTAPTVASKSSASNVTLRAGVTPSGFVLGGSF